MVEAELACEVILELICTMIELGLLRAEVELSFDIMDEAPLVMEVELDFCGIVELVLLATELELVLLATELELVLLATELELVLLATDAELARELMIVTVEVVAVSI